VVKKWLTPSIEGPFIRAATLVEGRGTSARIDFGDVPTMTGQVMWSNSSSASRIGHALRVVASVRCYSVTAMAEPLIRLTIADLANLSDMHLTSVASDYRARP